MLYTTSSKVAALLEDTMLPHAALMISARSIVYNTALNVVALLWYYATLKAVVPLWDATLKAGATH